MAPISTPRLRSLDPRTLRVVATFLAAIVLAALFAPAAVAGEGTENDPYMPGDSVPICHSGNGKKFVPIDPSVSSGGVHAGHEGHGHDIFPPYWFKQNVGDAPTFYGGQNWDTVYNGETGETIHGNGCKLTGEPDTVPVATLDPCDDDGFEFTLDNSGSDVDLTFVGTHSDTTQAFSTSVTAGQSVAQLVTVDEDAAYDITVTVTYEATEIYSQNFAGTRGCDLNPDVDLLNGCATEQAVTGITITLDNTLSHMPLQFTGTNALAGDAILFDVEVAEGDTETVFVPVAEDAAYQIDVAVTNDTAPVTSFDVDGTRNCDRPTGGGDPDPDPDPDPVPVVTLVPDIDIDKSADDDTYSVGDTVTYTYVITNTGETTLSTINLSDDVLGNLTDLLETRTLGPGESTTVTTTQVVTEDHVGSLTNVAVTSGLPPEGERVSATDEVTVDVAAVLGVVIDKPEPAPAPEPAPVEPAPEVAAEELPRTGMDSDQLMLIAFAMLLLGGLLLRRPEWE